MVYFGDGATSTGDFHEGMNFAGIHKLPVIFMVENNSYAISVPQDKQMAVPSAADKACGLGLPGISVDGTDIVAVYSAMQIAVERARSGEGATVIEARAYRLTPHSSDDDDRAYRSREEVETYKKSDPIPLTQRLLLSKKIATQAQLDEMEKRAQTEIEQAVADATAAPYPSPEEALHPVYAEEVTHA